jgi:hypothetical protein
MRSFVRARLWRGTLLAIVAFVGCAKSGAPKGPKLNLVPVAGNVTLDGKPLADAQVSFYLQGTSPEGFYGSAAATDAQGHYELQTMGQKGTVIGSYKVIVSKQVSATGAPLKPEEGMDMEQLRAAGNVKETVPAKYTDPTVTELSATVEKSKAEGYNFDLKSS